MALNKEKFIADAKAAGYSDDEINAELAATSSESSGFDSKDSSNSGWDSGRPPLTTTPGATATAIPQAGSRVEAESKRLEQKRTEKEQQAPVIPEFVQNPLMLAGAAAAGGAAVIGYKTLKDKMANSAAQPMAGAERREPSLFGAQRLDEPTWSASDPQTAPLSQEEMMNRLRGLAGETSAVNEPGFAQVPQAAAPTAPQGPNLTLAEAQARMAGVTPAAGEMVGPPEMVGPRQPIAPSAAKQAALADYESKIAASDERINQLLAAQKQNNEFIRINNEKIANQNAAPSAAPNSPATKAVTDTIQQLSQAETPVAGAAMPSRPVTPTPAAALPTGELRTGSGLPAYAGEGKPRERFPKEFKTTADIPKGYAFVPGMGAGTNVIRNDFGQAGYNALVQEQGGPFGADKETRDFIKQYNEQRVGPPATRELRKSLGLPMPENTKGIPMKIAKVGGVVGAIMAIPELANAAQNRDAGQAATVASGFLPPAIQALIYSGGLNAGAEEETRQLRMRDYALKAGRGVAQGYDPRQLIGVAPPTR